MKSETSTSALASETREEQIARITAVMSQDEEYIASHLARPAPETAPTKCLGCGGTGIRPELGGLDIECHACNGTGKAP